MRVEAHGIGSVMHVMKRGGRGFAIVRDEEDRYDFVRSLYILNDQYKDNDWRKYTFGKSLFYRPKAWPERRPLVSILAWTLLDNHFHLLLQEIEEGGIAKFMQRLCGSMTRRFNEKYDERGSIFQGGYKGRSVDSDEYLQYVHAYITVKNVFDMYPGGLEKALADFEQAWRFAGEGYPFSSFPTSASSAPSPLLDMDAIHALGLIRSDFRKYAHSMLTVHAKVVEDEIGALMLESW